MEKKRALVLGATGMVGSNLAKKLVADGWKVYGASRLNDREKTEEVRKAGVSLIRFDVLEDNPARLPGVDVLFLEIWDPSHPSLIWPVNFYGVGRVVERFAGVADMVNGSTINVYGESPEPVTEETPCRPTSYYGHSRISQEKLIDYFCSSTGKNCINLRYAHANSARRGLVRLFAELIHEERSLGDDPEAKVQVIAVEDIVRMTMEAVNHMGNPPVAVNCCHPRVWTKRQLAEAIRREMDHGKVVFDHKTGGEEKSAYADVSRMIEWFGEPLVPIDTILERAVSDLKK